MSSITLHMFEVSLCFCLSLNNTFGASPKNMKFSLYILTETHTIKNIKVKQGLIQDFLLVGGNHIFEIFFGYFRTAEQTNSVIG